jgi:UDP-glucose 6-dehydrogenase
MPLRLSKGGYCLRKQLLAIIDSCRKDPFSLLIHEINYKNSEKRLVVLVQLFNQESGMKGQILDLPVLSGVPYNGKSVACPDSPSPQ